ncbi:MAG TPA: cysteine dioxygenase family protein [Pseudonocardiaceae bacterium]|nr:cysteine dioxygenase family protein [Pseudonocardiaceae bacterium]
MFAVPVNTVALSAASASVHPARIAAEVARDRSRWAHLLRYDPEDRFSALVESTGDVETWLLSWLPGQHTDLHDHGGSAGAFTVVSGVLTELVIRDRAVEHSVVVGQTRVFGPRSVHQVRNAGVDPAVSIHVYRPERAGMTPYRFDPATGLTRLDGQAG